jgi:hypothetical protein
MGIPGNKMADKAAEAGSQSNRFTQMEICNSRTELKTFIRDARNLEWAQWGCTTGNAATVAHSTKKTSSGKDSVIEGQSLLPFM